MASKNQESGPQARGPRALQSQEHTQEPLLHKHHTSWEVGGITPLGPSKGGGGAHTAPLPEPPHPGSSPDSFGPSTLSAPLQPPPLPPSTGSLSHSPQSSRVCSQRHRHGPIPAPPLFKVPFGRLTTQPPGSHRLPLPQGLPSPSPASSGLGRGYF